MQTKLSQTDLQCDMTCICIKLFVKDLTLGTEIFTRKPFRFLLKIYDFGIPLLKLERNLIILLLLYIAYIMSFSTIKEVYFLSSFRVHIKSGVGLLTWNDFSYSV